MNGCFIITDLGRCRRPGWAQYGVHGIGRELGLGGGLRSLGTERLVLQVLRRDCYTATLCGLRLCTAHGNWTDSDVVLRRKEARTYQGILQHLTEPYGGGSWSVVWYFRSERARRLPG